MQGCNTTAGEPREGLTPLMAPPLPSSSSSTSNTPGARADSPSMTTPTTSVTPTATSAVGTGKPKSEMALLLANLELFIAVGVLEKPSGGDTSAIQDHTTSFPAAEIASLEKHSWIRTTTLTDCLNPHGSCVRVYVLPDDVGRKFIPRSSTALRRALKVVMSRVDPSPRAWHGESGSGEKVLGVSSAVVEDESLWYIFNTLQDPSPDAKTIRNPYAKQAMQDLLSITSPWETEDQEGKTFTGVLGLKTPLYPYQRRSAATMIQREVQPHQMLDPRLQPCTSPTGQVYYYDKEKGSIFREKRTYSEARGGILAETMGCGKTLICLAVVLATRGHFPQIPLEHQSMEIPERPRTGSLLEMAAATAGRLSLPWKAHFDHLSQMGEHYDRCIKACEASRGSYTVHPPVVRHTGRKSADHLRLPGQHLQLCSGTLIIVPPNLLDHWLKEIATHTEDLRVLVLRSSADVIPSAEEFFQYDIVLFSRTRFEKEADDFNDRDWHRHKESSPLTKLHWLRVIVDEGHNVAGHGSKTNMMHLLEQIHVERRWVVSGTPSSGLYGVEVSLASQETHTEDTDLTEATSAVLSGRKKTGKAVDHELKDLDKLQRIVVNFLDLRPWSNPKDDDPANWATYIKPVGPDGKRRKAPSLRATLQGLVVRHRLDAINSEIPLPRLHNKVVHLEPTFYDKLSLNLFIFMLAVNAVTSERTDQDYIFDTRNRKHLSRVVSNLRQAGFWWAGSDFELQGTVDVATKYLADHQEKMPEDDIALITQGIKIAQMALDSGGWNGFKMMHELGVFVTSFPEDARNFWALDPAQANREPLLLGISQARLAQQHVTKHLGSSDPAEGLAGAGIKIRSELTNREGFDASTAAPKKTTPESRIRKKAKETFTKGLFKDLPPDSPLTQTKLIATASAKLTYLLDQVQEYHKTEKIIIFYDNNNSAYWIAEGLELLGIDFRIYANTLKSALREEYLTLFRESEAVRVLLMDLKQASHGLHIAHASRVYIVNPIWQPNIESQAIKRAHRIGQTRPVFVETLVLQDTLEDKILQRRKAMSDTEIQMQGDLLDDSTMSSIIQNERFIPMPCCAGYTSLAYLSKPSGFFDRHRLPIPDSASKTENGRADGIASRPMPVTPTKRKQDLEPDLFAPRKRSPPRLRLQFRNENGIIMESPRPIKGKTMTTSIIALSGPSSSGKTTLARLLQRIFSNQPETPEQNPTQLKTFIIHEDDFYHPDDKIPSVTLPSGKLIQDWDCLGALDIPFLSSALGYVHGKGHLPPRLRSKEDLNDVSPNSGVEESLVEELRNLVAERVSSLALNLKGEGEGVTLALLEGFLLYAPGKDTEGGEGHGLRDVHDQIDVRFFLPAPYDLVKERREARSGYVTIGPAPGLPQRSSTADVKDDEGEKGEEVDLEKEDDRPPQNFWTDPPGYVDDIVWPRYVRDHAWLLLPEDGPMESLVLIEGDEELVRKVGQGVNVRMDAGVTVAPGQGALPMADLLKWAVEEVLKYMEQQYNK
ncbi:uncharacterized protein BDV14DRAFT_206606 [Aspergillus stella-maris]|uniref:uncharacterized protein n=1 Tax=Aspergillus stella-maris TaxID=1810926 RepID=UPI003CCDCC6F